MVRRNGCLQLAFGLVFAIGSGRWRIACALFVSPQPLAMVGVLLYDAEYLDSVLRHEMKKLAIVAYVISDVASQLGFLVTYLFVFHYVRKFNFVANVGMQFPCPPKLTRRHTDEENVTRPESKTNRRSDERQTKLDEETPFALLSVPSNSSVGHDVQTLSKSNIAINVIALLTLISAPVIWLIVICNGTLSQFADDPPSFRWKFIRITGYLQYGFAPFADIIIVLVFASVTQQAVDLIKLAKQERKTPSSFRGSTTNGQKEPHRWCGGSHQILEERHRGLAGHDVSLVCAEAGVRPRHAGQSACVCCGRQV